MNELTCRRLRIVNFDRIDDGTIFHCGHFYQEMHNLTIVANYFSSSLVFDWSSETAPRCGPLHRAVCHRV